MHSVGKEMNLAECRDHVTSSGLELVRVVRAVERAEVIEINRAEIILEDDTACPSLALQGLCIDANLFDLAGVVRFRDGTQKVASEIIERLVGEVAVADICVHWEWPSFFHVALTLWVVFGAGWSPTGWRCADSMLRIGATERDKPEEEKEK